MRPPSSYFAHRTSLALHREPIKVQHWTPPKRGQYYAASARPSLTDNGSFDAHPQEQQQEQSTTTAF
eukprot:267918-Amphidinium_carterae.1